jgi:hypothetical protein
VVRGESRSEDEVEAPRGFSSARRRSGYKEEVEDPMAMYRNGICPFWMRR